MAENHPDQGAEVVLRSVAEVVEEAESKNGPWPELGEPTFEEVSRNSGFAERVSVWTMASIMGAATIYSIATGNQEVLILVVTIAAGMLHRLTRRVSENEKPRGNNYDPRTKRRPRARTRSG